MDISWFRDLAIIILMLVATGVLITVTVLAFSLYRRGKHILDSVKDILDSVKAVVKPLVQIAAIIQGIRQGIDSASKFCKKKGGSDE
ncbi:hypothetical protein ES703_74919 [subsurface metagenome]